MTRQLSWAIVLGVMASACSVEPSESVQVAAATGPASVTTDATSYTYATPVVVTWSGLNGNMQDWIALAPQGSPLTTVTRWAYTGGAASGTATLEGPAPGGMYVARAFDNDTYTLMGESDPFAVADVSDTQATISVDQPDYAITTPIVVSFTGLPGNQVDWIAIAPQGAPDTTEAVWLYTGGQMNGSVTFQHGLAIASTQGFPGGYYVARAYLNDTYTRVAETAPFLDGAIVTTNLSSYDANRAITVSWTHLSGTTGEWIGLSPAGSKSDSVIKWVYTNGAVDGSVTFFPGLPTSGSYVARAYAPDTYYEAGESAPFTVTPSAAVTVTTDMSSYTLGQNVTVTWSGLPGNQHDWIAIAPDGSPDTTVTRWVYTNAQASGSFTFEGPPAAGTYVARAFYDDQYIKLGESTAFPVN